MRWILTDKKSESYKKLHLKHENAIEKWLENCVENYFGAEK